MIMPSERADARMRMFNADGSEGEMCGNGVRCVAKYLFDHGLASKKQLTIETGRGILTLDLEVERGRVQRVRVDMGAPILQRRRDSDAPAREPADRRTDRGGRAHAQGNRRVDGKPAHRRLRPGCRLLPLEAVGPVLEHHKAFPRRVNVHVVEIKSQSEVTMRTWERGSGITLACGTGACAVCVAGVLTGRTARRLIAHLPGGDLELEWPVRSGIRLHDRPSNRGILRRMAGLSVRQGTVKTHWVLSRYARISFTTLPCTSVSR